MMVITLRCNQSCRYCQVSSAGENSYEYDMPPVIARKVVDVIFKSPSKHLKIEFQGGEPTLNWETLVKTVKYANKLNEKFKKNLEIIVCTNLTAITPEKLDFFKEFNIKISTSLDRNKFIHNKNRILRNNNDT